LNLTGVWEGTLDGTNWGRLLVKLTEQNRGLTGQAEIVDVGIGTFALDVTGRRDAEAVKFRLTPTENGLRTYPGTIDAQIDSETNTLIRGTWRSSINTRGTFRAERGSAPQPTIEAAAKRIEKANAAFIIMAFSEQAPGHLPIVDIHAAIRRGCDTVGVKAHRADEVEHSGSITKLIFEEIQKHRFLISDLTHERPNVYYEIGLAHGMAKEVVLTAHKGTTLHFDIAAYNVIIYASGTELEERIARRLRARIENAEQLNA
jgi:hypothetical protein